MEEQLTLPGVPEPVARPLIRGDESQLTEWRDGPPPMTGWWETRRTDGTTRREQRRFFWVTGWWSDPAYVGEDDEEPTPTPGVQMNGIQWRGLVERPANGYAYPLVLVEDYWKQP